MVREPVLVDGLLMSLGGERDGPADAAVAVLLSRLGDHPDPLALTLGEAQINGVGQALRDR